MTMIPVAAKAARISVMPKLFEGLKLLFSQFSHSTAATGKCLGLGLTKRTKIHSLGPSETNS